jgi:hypothetical protein
MSLLLFGLSVLVWLMLTVFESALVGMSPMAERLVTFVLLALPALVGAVLGVMSLERKEGQTWLAVAGITLNTLFALFIFMIILFAG